MEEPIQIEPTKKSKKRRSRRKKWLKLLLVLILIAAAAAGGYYYRDKQAKTELDSKQAEISALNDKVSSLEKELETEKAKQEEAEKSDKKGPTAKTLENIKAAVNSGNTAALESLMASKVNVILAASEGNGSRTAMQAVEDLKYVENAAKPWEFSLPADTLNSYKNGFYGKYFPADALVGKSSDNYVISFTFDDNGKIDGIFMASDASLLL